MPLAILELECLRCGYKWYPRSDKLPQRCAKCNSLYWNKPKLDKSNVRNSNVPTSHMLTTCKLCGNMAQIIIAGVCKRCYMQGYMRRYRRRKKERETVPL